MFGKPYCIVLVTHTLNDWILRNFERLRDQAPEDHDVILVASSEDLQASTGDRTDGMIVQIKREDLFALDCPAKLDPGKWEMAGNLDLIFLAFIVASRATARIGSSNTTCTGRVTGAFSSNISRSSTTGLLAATVQDIRDVPHKLAMLSYPPLVLPETIHLKRDQL